jgi:hypothetical protein
MWYRLKEERRGAHPAKGQLTLKPGTPMQVTKRYAASTEFTSLDGSYTWVSADDTWHYFSTKRLGPLILLAGCADEDALE